MDLSSPAAVNTSSSPSASPKAHGLDAPAKFAPTLKAELKEWLPKVYEVKEPNCIFVFKFRTHFRGGRSSRFGLIYDNLESARKFEPKYRFIRAKMDAHWNMFVMV
ncbi:40S ribosomal protein S24-2 [Triticum urartu]|uniref:40S ribosomal protein S24-2 n=1 Tax=Triticum urartu TaxID=4572 RepID=M7Z7X6_TRIUA|nr:40S ribosomal protein S24-2 [Triticum urartu]